ncbi:hypothetical protein SAY86_009479 [Trapa natans]|uniref:Uncharacterized protein n=1 Tax=Trapa natans TaxID=22666 RepID=A0AAN7QPU2_TRANT|nr:hypothetical protein SAY86_009479 [Trapa natans]
MVISSFLSNVNIFLYKVHGVPHAQDFSFPTCSRTVIDGKIRSTDDISNLFSLNFIGHDLFLLPRPLRRIFVVASFHFFEDFFGVRHCPDDSSGDCLCFGFVPFHKLHDEQNSSNDFPTAPTTTSPSAAS